MLPRLLQIIPKGCEIRPGDVLFRKLRNLFLGIILHPSSTQFFSIPEQVIHSLNTHRLPMLSRPRFIQQFTLHANTQPCSDIHLTLDIPISLWSFNTSNNQVAQAFALSSHLSRLALGLRESRRRRITATRIKDNKSNKPINSNNVTTMMKS